MALSLDPAVRIQMDRLTDALGKTDPAPVGDVESRRVNGHRMFDYIGATSAPIPGVDTEKFPVTAGDGTALSATWYRRSAGELRPLETIVAGVPLPSRFAT